jgi:hypothetical protein
MDETETPTREATLVRGADGELYLISKDCAPIKLEGELAEQTMNIVSKVEEELTKRVEVALTSTSFGGTHNVHVVFKDAVPRK